MTNMPQAEARPEDQHRLPKWDLSDLYAGPDDPRIKDDLAWAKSKAETFHAAYAGKLNSLNGDELGEAIAAYEAITERLHRVMSFAQLRFSANISDPARGRFLQTMQEKFNDVSSQTLFFTLELNGLGEDKVEAFLTGSAASRYAPWVRDMRIFRPHQLSDEVEQLLHDKSVTGSTAWVRLFDQTLAQMRFDVRGESLTLADTLNLFDYSDGDVRRDAAKEIGSQLHEHIGTFTLIANTLAKDKEIEDRWRRYAHPVSYRNLSNRVEDEVVEALVDVIRGAYAELAHRYYGLKARWFGVDVIPYWDRNAPLPGDDNRKFSWPEAKGIVVEAFGRFHPLMAEIAEQFFSDNWIDAAPHPGKDSGAFSHPVVPSLHPYILMNFFGRPRDVMTLAHELGHGVHQVLAAPQGALMADTPLTLAESASVFGEMLVFRALLKEQTDSERRRRLLAGKVESMLNTVVRQIAFHEFETRVHRQRRTEELSSEQMGEIWLSVQRDSLGPALRFDDEYRHYWAYIPHFIHVPFYVYAYAFGDCLVNSLYQVYCEGQSGFEEKYLNMLRAGGTLRHRDLLRPFGLDASDPEFWRRGLNVIAGFIDELEALT